MHGKNQKNIIVTAIAEGTAVGDTTKGKTTEDVKKDQAALAKGKGWETVAKTWAKSGVPGKPTEVTLPTLSIQIDKGGETIAAQSVTASKSGLETKDLTTAGKKTTVTATATIIVTAEAEGTAVGDTTKAAKLAEDALKAKTLKLEASTAPAEAKKAWKESGAPGKPTEVTLLYSITEETAVGDTMKVTEKATKALEAKKKGKTSAKDGYESKYHKQVAGKPAEVTLPTLSIILNI